MSIARHHTEWLSLVPVSGPFLSLPVLMEAFPQGLDAHDADHSRLLRLAYEEWDENFQSKKLDPSVHEAWIKFVLTKTLEYEESLLAEGQAIPQTLQVEVSEQGELLRPSLVLNGPGTQKARLLIQTYPRSQDLNTYVAGSRWKASPDTRMTDLLHATGVRLGLVTNGEHWMLVDAPKGETTGYASWYASLWREEKITLQAFRSLLSMTRLFGVSEDQTIETLLTKSASNQQEVTTQLGLQVLRAVEVLIQSLDRADQDHGRELLDGINEAVLYESALNVMMRLVFLFCAEERELIPTKPFPVYEQNYSVSTISRQLREIADQHGEELLERRFDAWPRLLSAFRVVYGGVRHDDVYMPAYGGRLFDPDRFPFLEGRKPKTSWLDTEATPLPVNNRTVLHLLEALQFLEMKVPGIKEKTLRRISFRHLDIEQIGHVYEGLLDHTAKRAAEPFLGLAGSKGKEPEVSLTELEKHREKGVDALLKFLKEETGRTPKSLEKDLNAEFDTQEIARFRTACQTEELWERIEPFAGLIRPDTFGYPLVIPQGSVFVTEGTDRRSSGTHYTPRSLTEPIVQYTLEPLVYVGPAEGKPKSEWKLKSAAELLELKICDMACGSGAFLVQAARYMSVRLMEAWEAAKKAHPETPGITPEGKPSTGEPNESLIPTDPVEQKTYAMRIVAQRCLYGVDINPLAAEMAKLSLWLLTLAKDKPFEFLDHSIRCGDSLVGLHSIDQLRHFSLKPDADDEVLFKGPLDSAVDEAITLRLKLEDLPANTVEEVERQEKLLKEADDKIARLRCSADLLVSAEFWGENAKDKQERVRHAAVVSGHYIEKGPTEEFQQAAAKERRGQKMFHWALEFPEVIVKRGGFDAFVGNPPFVGGKRLATVFGNTMQSFLKATVEDSKGAADLCVYFFRRAFSLGGDGSTLGLLATNTISQGDTKDVGLGALVNRDAHIMRAISSLQWPGTAGVFVASVYVYKGKWNGVRFLNECQVQFVTAGLLDESPLPPAQPLKENSGLITEGIKIHGNGFVLEPEEADLLIEMNKSNASVIAPYLGGEDVANIFDLKAPRYVINFGTMDFNEARQFAKPFEMVTERVKPYRDGLSGQIHESRYWIFWDRREKFFQKLKDATHILVCSGIAKYIALTFVESGQVLSQRLKVFQFQDWGHFSTLQSSIHDCWVRRNSSTLGETLSYSNSDAFSTFPSPTDVKQCDSIGDAYHDHRMQVMLSRQEGLTDTYNRFHDSDETSTDIQKLRDLHVEMDQAVAAAYGWTDLELGHDFHETKQGIRFTISEPARREVLQRLLKLNHERYAEEVKQGLHTKKGAAKKAPAEPKPKKPASNPVVAARRLFGDDDATFPSTERDHFLCRLVCELVKAEPGLTISEYVDSLVIALGHKRYKQLLTGKDRTQFEKLCKASPLASWSDVERIPWGELQNLLTRRHAIDPDNQMIQIGPDLDNVLKSYPAIRPELVVLLRKAAAELRDLQAQADPGNATFVGEITPEKAEILKAISHDRSQWFGVAA